MKLFPHSFFLLVFLFCSVFISKISAQYSASDSAFYQTALTKSIANYQNIIGHQSRLFNGNKYVGYPFYFKTGHPFFNNDKFVIGTILYDKVLYTNILLLFNEISGTVLLKDNANTIQLVTDRIDKFSLENNQFISLKKDSLNEMNLPKNGIYQMLYNGKIKVFKQEQKFINEDISDASVGIIRSVGSKDYFFIKSNNLYYPINKNKDLINVFSNYKKEINLFVKNENLSFKNDIQNTILNVSEYYDKYLNK